MIALQLQNARKPVFAQPAWRTWIQLMGSLLAQPLCDSLALNTASAATCMHIDMPSAKDKVILLCTDKMSDQNNNVTKQ